jgi:predicted secreted protein
VTGLVWEVKTTNGLHSQGNLYSWYNPDAAVNGGAPGVQNGGRCEGSKCDTYAYVQEVNKQGLCGAKDWRLPGRKELHAIVDNGHDKPAIDTSYFPNTPASHFWTASPYADQTGFAWQINFQYGEALTAEKSQGSLVRLVRRPK